MFPKTYGMIRRGLSETEYSILVETHKVAFSVRRLTNFKFGSAHIMLEKFSSLSLEEPEVELSLLLKKLDLGIEADIGADDQDENL